MGRWCVQSGTAAVALGIVLGWGKPCLAASGPACPTADCDPSILVRRTLAAARIDSAPPVIDGRLDEPFWAAAPAATGFVEGTPRPAAPASLRSEARVLVDDEALYVGLRYFDPEPRNILAPLARRDDETTSDWAFVEIDSRHDRRTGFSFGVNPRGVQVDGLWLSETEYDTAWNSVWEAAATVDEQGWTAEFRIPFSQLAFRLPERGEDMVWGINFYRYSPSHGESSNWSPRYRGLAGVVSNFNDCRLPAPPRVRRLELDPYVAPRIGNDRARATEPSIRTGADLKLGLGPNFSLAATVVPDFGQVEADPSQVNLTGFELFQSERRPFFLEGLDVFRLSTSLPFASRGLSFADEAPFYSRRVGRAPAGELPPDASVESIPSTTTLLAAAKLSGQTPQGWTLGVFTAATDRAAAELRRADGSTEEWPLESRATLTVARAIKSFGAGGSWLGVFASDLHRFGLGPTLAGQEVRDAAALGGDVQYRFGGQQYEVRSWLLGSRLSGDDAAIARVAEAPHHYFQRPDAPRLHDTPYGESLSGIAGEARLSRVGGALRWDLIGRAIAPGFDVDQVGFQRSSDWLLLAGTWRYDRFRPGHKIRAWTVGSSNLGVGWTFAGEPRARVADVYGSIDTRGYWNVKLRGLFEGSALSTEWLRGGPALRVPPRTGVTFSLLTDQRKATYASLDAVVTREPATGASSLSVSPLVNVRSSDRLQWSIGSTWRGDAVAWQYVGRVQSGEAADEVVARLDQRTLALTLRAELTLSPRLALQAYVQPFATVGRYRDYQRLVAPRDGIASRRFAPLAPSQVVLDPGTATLGLDVDGDGAIDARLAAPDGQERTLNSNVVLRWEYRPASFLTAVWSHQRSARSGDPTVAPGSALADVFRDPPTNVLLVKASLHLGL